MSQSHEEQIIADLIEALRARRWETRVQAVDALITLGEPAMMPLMEAIRQHLFEDFMLPEAVRVLGSIGDARVVDLLMEVLKDENVYAAQEAVRGLGRIRDPRAIPVLIDVLRHDWDDEETIRTWQGASHALAAIGKVALGPLLNVLQNEEGTVLLGTIDALGQLKDERAVAPLVKALHDQDWQVRADAANALGQIGSQQSIEPLIALLADENAYVRLRTCYALCVFRSEMVCDVLIHTLQDTEVDVRSAVVTNLGRMLGMYVPVLDHGSGPEERRVIEHMQYTRGEQVRKLLLESLQDPAGVVRAAAAHTLGELGDERALPALHWIEQNDTSYAGTNRVSEAATRALQRLQERYQGE